MRRDWVARFAIGTFFALGLTNPALAMKLKPFDTPAPSVDPAKVATMKPGTNVVVDYDQILMIGPKGWVDMKIEPKDTLPADARSATPGIEVRLRGDSYARGFKEVDFSTRVSGEQHIVYAFLGVTNDKDRLIACGYYVRKDGTSFAADFFYDLRSYIDIGGALRLPAAFLRDQTGAAPRADGKMLVRCVNTNIEWDESYRRLPIALHLEEAPFAYEWKVLQSSGVPTTPTALPSSALPTTAVPPTQTSPYD
jgi:hypothetical protein